MRHFNGAPTFFKFTPLHHISNQLNFVQIIAHHVNWVAIHKPEPMLAVGVFLSSRAASVKPITKLNTSEQIP